MSNTGTYKYTVAINKGVKVESVKDTDSNKSYKEVKNEANSDATTADADEKLSRVASENFSDSWVTADGLRKSETNLDAEQISLTISGTNYSIKPLECEGEVTLVSSNATQSGLRLLGYYVKDNVLYLDLSQTRQALLSSGNEDLIKYGKSLPDFTSVMKFEKDELVLDNINDTSQVTNLDSFSYVTFRKEFLRALSVLLDSASSGLDEGKCFAVQDNKYYLTVDNNNVQAFQGVVKSLSDSTEEMYQSYLKKLEADKVVSDKQLQDKSKVVTNISKANKDLLNKVLDITKGKDFQSVNWVRNTKSDKGNISELSLQVTGTVNNRQYLVTVVGESNSVIDEADTLKLPSGAINYRTALDVDKSLVFSEFIGKLKDIKAMSLDEIKELTDSEDEDDLDSGYSVDITDNIKN